MGASVRSGRRVSRGTTAGAWRIIPQSFASAINGGRVLRLRFWRFEHGLPSDFQLIADFARSIGLMQMGTLPV